jgi:hypothetical protein
MSATRINYGILAAACAAVVVEATSNALFAYELGGLARITIGGHDIAADGALLAVASVVIAVFQAHSATTLLERPNDPNRNWTALFLCVCLFYSTGAMASHILKMQQHAMDKEARARSLYDGAKRDRDAAAATVARLARDVEGGRDALAKVEKHRSLTAIQADIPGATPKPDAWKLSAQCTARLHEPWLREACAPMLRLYQERSEALEASTKAAAAETAKGQLATAEAARAAAELKLAGIDAPSDAWAVRVWLAQVLPWVVAVAIEICATLGFKQARRPAAPIAPDPPAPRSPPSRNQVAKPSTLGTLLADLSAGTASAPGCTVDADGWICGTLDDLGAVLGVKKATVSRDLANLKSQGLVATRPAGRRNEIKWL